MMEFSTLISSLALRKELMPSRFNYKTIIRAIFFLLLIFILQGYLNETLAQSKRYGKNKIYEDLKRNWSVQWNMGAGLYFGDLSQYDNDPLNKIFKESKLSSSLVISNKFISFLALQGRFIFNQYQTSNEIFNRKLQGYSYVIGTNLQFDLVNFMAFPNEPHPDIYVYLLFGIGTTKMCPKIYNLESGDQIELNTIQKKMEFMIYYGLGANVYLYKNWDLTLETIIQNIGTDKLDGIIVGQPDDFLIYTSIGIKYNFPYLGSGNKYLYRSKRTLLRR